jgi:hypothetical protein
MVVVSRSSIRDTWQNPSRRRPQNGGGFFCAGASGKIHDPILMRFQPPVD